MPAIHFSCAAADCRNRYRTVRPSDRVVTSVVRESLCANPTLNQLKPQRYFRLPKKLRPALGGELAARDPVWDGEGWGCDRVACPFIRVSLAIAGAGSGDRGTAVAKRDPYVRVALRLTLDEAVSGLGPGHDVF